MKTIMSGQPDTNPNRPRGLPRKRMAVLACAALAACVLPVAAAVLPAKGEPSGPGPEDVAGRPAMAMAPQELMADPGGGMDGAGYAAAADPAPEAPGYKPDIRVERSGQLVYQGIPDADAGDGGTASGNSPDVAAVPAGTYSAPDDTDGGSEPTEAAPSQAPAAQPAQGAQDSMGAAAAELDAARLELEALRKELAAERKARQDAEVAARAAQQQPQSTQQPAQQPQSTQQPAQQPQATQQPAQQPDTGEAGAQSPSDDGPPSWLTGPGDPPADPIGPPDTLATALERAMWWHPYDNGPLNQKSFAQIPCALEGCDTRMYVELGAPCSTLTQGDLLAFVDKAVRNCDATWATIVGSDGKGLQFMGCGIDMVPYGYLDEYGQVTEVICFLMLTDTGYGIVEPKG